MVDINKIAGIDQVHKTGKTRPAHKPQNMERTDSVSLSSEARKMAEIQRTVEIIREAPDIRADKVESARRLIESGAFSERSVLEKVADKLLENMGL